MNPERSTPNLLFVLALSALALVGLPVAGAAEPSENSSYVEQALLLTAEEGPMCSAEASGPEAEALAAPSTRVALPVTNCSCSSTNLMGCAVECGSCCDRELATYCALLPYYFSDLCQEAHANCMCDCLSLNH